MRCCSRNMNCEKVGLQNIGQFEHRVLYIYTCPVCSAIKYELREYDVVTGNLVLNRNKPSKKKNIPEWANSLIKLSRAFAYFDEIKKGNRSNMGFIYGKTTAKEHIGYDFNGTERSRVKIKKWQEKI